MTYVGLSDKFSFGYLLTVSVFKAYICPQNIHCEYCWATYMHTRQTPVWLEIKSNNGDPLLLRLPNQREKTEILRLIICKLIVV